MHRTKGFTLIELLIVVVIIGILAAIAIPKFGATKGKAYVASMKADLRNLVTAEESYFADHTTYSGTLANLQFGISAGNTVVIANVAGSGWSATATNTTLGTGTGNTCGIYVGSATPVPNAAVTNEGAPACW